MTQSHSNMIGDITLGTTAVTFTVRYGSDGGTCAKNGVDSGRRYGAILGWTMIVEEIEV